MGLIRFGRDLETATDIILGWSIAVGRRTAKEVIFELTACLCFSPPKSASSRASVDSGCVALCA